MFKNLMKRIREYKKDTILAPVFVMCEVILETVLPTIIALLVDSLQAGKGFNVILKYGIIMFVIAMLSLGCGVLSGYFAARASAGFARNLRHDLFYKIQTFSFANIDKFSSSSLITRLTTDVTNIQNAFMMLVRIAVRSPFMLIAALIMSIRMSPSLSLVYLFVIPVLAIGLGIIIKVTMPIFRRIFKKYDKLNESVEENVSGIRVVKSYVREDYEDKKFKNASQELRKDFTHVEKILAFNGPIMLFAVYTTMIVISVIGSYVIVKSGNTAFKIGELSGMMTYSMQILMSLIMFSMIFVMIILSLESIRRVNEVLTEQPTISDPENPITTVKDGSIDFDHVNFAYSGRADKNVLDNIDLHIKSGETIGIIGGTGSSKSSLIQLIPRLYDVTSGDVKVGGVDVRNYDIESLRNEVSVVLQQNVLFSGTIKDNIRWGDENASDEEVEHVCKLAQADEFIQKFPNKYDTYIEQGGTNVSGGQKQRLCIARAILKKPKVLILDDSTSAVDTKTDALIRKAMYEEIPNTTKIIIAQRISSVQDADRILVLEGGKINGLGTHDELLKSNEIYREIYLSQTKTSQEEQTEKEGA